MSILSAQSIRKAKIITPFHERTVHNGMSYGLGPASYDVRIAQDIVLERRSFAIASTIEHFNMPDDITGEVFDKSTWARRGLSAFNTFIDPGWRGYLTLELVNNGHVTIVLREGDPVVQIKFSWLDDYSDSPYVGKYQDQPDMPVEAIVL